MPHSHFSLMLALSAVLAISACDSDDSSTSDDTQSADTAMDTQADTTTDTSEVTEAEIVVCSMDADCIVVPYSHCCGSTKRAINQTYLDDYNANPEWQTFDDPDTCAVIGACQDDSGVTEARCEQGMCVLVY